MHDSVASKINEISPTQNDKKYSPNQNSKTDEFMINFIRQNIEKSELQKQKITKNTTKLKKTTIFSCQCTRV